MYGASASGDVLWYIWQEVENGVYITCIAPSQPQAKWMRSDFPIDALASGAAAVQEENRLKRHAEGESMWMAVLGRLRILPLPKNVQPEVCDTQRWDLTKVTNELRARTLEFQLPDVDMPPAAGAPGEADIHMEQAEAAAEPEAPSAGATSSKLHGSGAAPVWRGLTGMPAAQGAGHASGAKAPPPAPVPAKAAGPPAGLYAPGYKGNPAYATDGSCLGHWIGTMGADQFVPFAPGAPAGAGQPWPKPPAPAPPQGDQGPGMLGRLAPPSTKSSQNNRLRRSPQKTRSRPRRTQGCLPQAPGKSSKP